jgi:hypothetical protein
MVGAVGMKVLEGLAALGEVLLGQLALRWVRGDG